MASSAALKVLLKALRAEQARRARQLGRSVDGDAHEQLMAELDLMASRARSMPGYIEPTPAEKALRTQELERWLRGWKREHDRRGRSVS